MAQKILSHGHSGDPSRKAKLLERRGDLDQRDSHGDPRTGNRKNLVEVIPNRLPLVTEEQTDRFMPLATKFWLEIRAWVRVAKDKGDLDVSYHYMKEY